MSAKVRGIYQSGGAGPWLYDLQIHGNRFSGTTGCTVRRDAEKWITAFREQKKREIAEYDGSDRAMTFAVASTRWWNEAGQHRKDSRDMERVLAWLQREIGNGKRIAAIDDNLISQLVLRRRGEGVSAGTVNRSMTEPLRAILSRAENLWGQRVKSIAWKQHKLREPQERVREMTADEEKALFSALRPDFVPVARFLLITGLRRAEACGLKWSDVDLASARITVRGKGDTVNTLPMPAAAMAILRAMESMHGEFVFTYVVKHPWGGKRGQRIPIAPDTLGTAYWRARKKAGITDLKLHDFRHTAATRMLRKTGNMKLVQKLLRHQRITTTARYAHATDEDLLSAMEATSPVVSPIPEAAEESKPRKSKAEKAG